ncbi:AAA family ATPase [Solirubrobacter phytolaccae]|uniref:AAA family ATPase n=1 Tax=Solirubrobacter phytolaccae TaxID=1404360 RepID=A0A9X3N4Y0_9ACTN|nr:adenylate/guanylate cyclase domain-containing protein [Solirubrobacter phytolaccae]MDA0179965.1 AAA family ATPase [Solirubrobacter phytolaccae]
MSGRQACLTCDRAIEPDHRFCPRCGTALAPDAAAPGRKTITILFCDLEGFTSFGERFDPETQLQVIGRYYDALRPVIQAHGGRPQKYIGDAIQALFGVPQLHEDDALRAARCALAMREALTKLNVELGAQWGVTLRARYGIATGEVAVGSVDGQRFFALGDPVNVASRLETAAPLDQVLVDARTASLLDGHAVLGPAEPLRLKGKSAPVLACRLRGLIDHDDDAHEAAPRALVGRATELAALHAALDHACERRRATVRTVVGPAGIGKSSLVRRFMDEVEPRGRAVFGRCLPYGEGVTLRPLAEIVERLAGGTDRRTIAAVLGDDEDARRVAARISLGVGFTEGPVPFDEIVWAARRLLEAAARERPLVVVVEDVHWAAPTLVELLDHVAATAREVPLLIVGLARPEWRERADRITGEVTLPLGPLSAHEAERLLAPEDALTAEQRTGVLHAAEGNPLFLEQLVALAAETGAASTALPATVQAVLGERVDALTPAEREVVDCAAVVGRTFDRALVASLLTPRHRDRVDASLHALIARDMLRPDGDAFRFSHILLRDEVYELVAKTRRAELHHRVADALVAEAAHDDIVGYHYEQAHAFGTGLHPRGDPGQARIANAAATHLGAAGRAALGRDELSAAAGLLERAVGLLERYDDPALGVLAPELGVALTHGGQLPRAKAVLRDAARRAAARGSAVDEAHARVALLGVYLQTGSAAPEIRRRFPALRTIFEAAGDELGLARLWRLRALMHWIDAHSAEADEAWELAVDHARRAGDTQGYADAFCWLASSTFAGPAPAEEGIVRCELIQQALGDLRRARAFVLQPLAALHAMRGELGAARELIGASHAMLADLTPNLQTAVAYHEAFIDMLAGEPDRAEATLRAGHDRLDAMGETALRADTAAALSRAVFEQGRPDEALALTRDAELGAAGDDRSAQIAWRVARAPVLAHRGELEDADRLSAEAVAILGDTDWLHDLADALLVRADVLRVCSDADAAETATRASLDHFERKGDVVMAERARARLVPAAPQPTGGVPQCRR